MYYLIERKYTGPNQDQEQYVDASHIEISTVPATTNSSHEERIEGWCGTTNDWSVHAHGEYATLEEARAAIAEKFGEVRSSNAIGERFESSHEDVVETYKPGKYEPMTSEQTADWVYYCMKSDVQAQTTDERILELIAEYEDEANGEGSTLNEKLEQFMHEHRQELRDDLDDEE